MMNGESKQLIDALEKLMVEKDIAIKERVDERHKENLVIHKAMMEEIHRINERCFVRTEDYSTFKNFIKDSKFKRSTTSNRTFEVLKGLALICISAFIGAVSAIANK